MPADIAWLSRAGAPRDDADAAAARDYRRALGGLAAECQWVADWPAALALLQRGRWDEAWWEAEQAQARALMAQASCNHGQTQSLQAITRTLDAVSDLLLARARAQLERSGRPSEEWARVAAGAAGQALYQHTLADLANAAPSHPLRLKFELWRRGRWPLGVFGGTLYIF